MFLPFCFSLIIEKMRNVFSIISILLSLIFSKIKHNLGGKKKGINIFPMCTLILFAYIYLDKLFSLKLHIFTISYSKEVNLNDHAWVNIKKEKINLWKTYSYWLIFIKLLQYWLWNYLVETIKACVKSLQNATLNFLLLFFYFMK